MSWLEDVAAWVRGNQALFSGLVALAALAGIILRPVSKGALLVWDRRRKKKTERAADGQARPAVSSAVVTPLEPLLAVLAFDNLSSDPEMQFFSDGVSEDIIQHLSHGGALKVIGRTTSFQFRGERKAEAGEKLRCSHILDGSIRRAEGKVRISAHLDDAANKTTLWSETYNRALSDILVVQEDIASNIARALKLRFSVRSLSAIDPDDYDLYLKSSPSSFAPDELRASVSLLEVVTKRAPGFSDAWGRLAYLRSFLHFYLPYSERTAVQRVIEREAGTALELDAGNMDALIGQLFAIPPFGQFIAADSILEHARSLRGSGDGRKYIGWYLRTLGRVNESVAAAQDDYRIDPLDTMTVNLLALAMLAAGRLGEAARLFEGLVESVPGMSFPLSSLLRVYAFQEDWAGVDRLTALAEKRSLREFVDGLPFIRAKRHPTQKNIDAMRSSLKQRVADTGCIDVARLVYAANLGLVDEAYAAAEKACLGPNCGKDDIMGPDAYRTSLLFQANMPQLRNDIRFPALCARLGLVRYWTQTEKWPDCHDQVPYDFKVECRRAGSTPEETCNY